MLHSIMSSDFHFLVPESFHKPEDHWSCKCSPDISANYKHKTWLQMTEGFFSTSFYLISESPVAAILVK